MDLLKDNLKKLYLRFLIPSLGSAMVMSIYTLTDAIVIGKGVGSDGNRRGGACVRDWHGDSGVGWNNTFFQLKKSIEIHPAKACDFQCGADYRKRNSKLFQ